MRFIAALLVASCMLGACGVDLAASEQAITADARTEPLPFPESDECLYTRQRLGESNGRPVLGPPVLAQNHCQAGLVCGRGALDACTPTDAEQFTCGCIAAATACNPVQIAAGLGSSDFRTREDAEARAKDCCRQPDFLNELRREVIRLDVPEAGRRYDRLRASCLTCSFSIRNEGSFTFDPFEGGATILVVNDANCIAGTSCNAATCSGGPSSYSCQCTENPVDASGQESYCEIWRGNDQRSLSAYRCRNDEQCDMTSDECTDFQYPDRSGPYQRCPCKAPAYPALADGYCRFIDRVPAGNNCPDGYQCSPQDASCVAGPGDVKTCECTAAPAEPAPPPLAD